MVDNIKAAFARRIDALDWMAPETKEEAKAKVETMEVGVGYPDTWTDYSVARAVAPDTAYANKQAAEKLRYRQQLAKIGKPLDTRRVVDERAAGQRGQPAGAERAQLPRRDPAARRSSIPRPIRRSTTARSAR